VTPLKASELARRLKAELRGDDVTIQGFATDNRDVVPGDLFIALRGAKVDGHDFCADAMSRGSVACLVDRPVNSNRLLLVSNVIQALSEMALSFRDEFNGPVIGITGSAGKTTTKEFVSACMGPLGFILKTEGNRNSEITGPLVWPGLTEQTKAVVVELGMRGLGQITTLAEFHRPTIAIITNIGFAHMELVGGRPGIVKAKSEILHCLPESGTALLWTEDEYLGDLIHACASRKVRTFGFGGNADCQITSCTATTWHSSVLEGVLDGQRWTATMPSVGKHLAINASAAILAATEVGVSLLDATRSLQEAKLPPMRMEIRDFHGATLVMDNYNSNPAALRASIETLEEVPCSGQRVVVLGTMRELGESSEREHRAIGRSLARSKIDHVIVFGEDTEHILDGFLERGGDAEKVCAAQSREQIPLLLESYGEGDTILVKASRALELEKAFV
jgi:UDP-N-acetylmuramoyl-tripeptide--D-alanyl-D-alanine ligase